MNNYTIYDHIFPNGKHYIGQTCQRVKSRWGKGGKGYLKCDSHNRYCQPQIARAINKYGWDNIEHKILFTDCTKEQADYIEVALISLHKEIGDCYNTAEGGGFVRKPSELPPRDPEEVKKEHKEYHHKWYLEHREESLQKCKEWAEAHSAELKEYKHQYNHQYYLERKDTRNVKKQSKNQ